MDWTQENGRPRNRSKTRRKREIRATISQLRRKLARNFKLVNSSRAIIWKICRTFHRSQRIYIFSNTWIRSVETESRWPQLRARGSPKVHNCRYATRQVAFYRFIIENRATFLLTVRACTFPVGKKKKLDSMHLACNLCVHPSNGWNVEYSVFRNVFSFLLLSDIFGVI